MKLGHTYRDRITGFKGVATGYVEYISGCHQALLAPQAKSDGEMPSSQWFDIQRLEITDADVIVLENGTTPGCDAPAQKR